MTTTDRRTEYYARAFCRPDNAVRIIAAETAAKVCAAYGITGMDRHRLVRSAIQLRQDHGITPLALIHHLEGACRRMVGAAAKEAT